MATDTMAVNNSQEYQVIAPSEATRFEVRENYDSSSAPTCDLIQTQPYGGVAVKVPKGTSAIYSREAPWAKGEVIGGIKTSSGSCTLAIIPGSQV